jgi:hypothetical protein
MDSSVDVWVGTMGTICDFLVIRRWPGSSEIRSNSVGFVRVNRREVEVESLILLLVSHGRVDPDCLDDSRDRLRLTDGVIAESVDDVVQLAPSSLQFILSSNVGLFGPIL